MKVKFILAVLCSIFFLSSCKDKDSYVLEGNIQGLNNPTLYFITQLGNNDTKIDTISSEKGEFKFVSSSDSLRPIVVYMEEGDVWFTVWVKNGQKMKISGDANYPELIDIHGNDIHNHLSAFKQTNKDIIKEMANLTDKLNQNTEEETKSVLDETYTTRLNLEQSFIRNVEIFLKDNPGSIASLILIQDYLLDSKNPEKIREYLSLITSPAKEDNLYVRLDAACQKLLQTSVGNPAPDFSIRNIKGDTLSLNSFNGRLLILSFEKSGCGVCNEDYPIMEEIYKKTKREDVEILSVVFDEEDKDWFQATKEHNINWQQSIDNYGLASPFLNLYNVNAIPDYFLIDGKGIIIASHVSVKEIENLIKEKIKMN